MIQIADSVVVLPNFGNASHRATTLVGSPFREARCETLLVTSEKSGLTGVITQGTISILVIFACVGAFQSSIRVCARILRVSKSWSTEQQLLF